MTETTRKMAVIMAADVEGYSRQMELDDEATVHELKQLREIFSGIVAAEGGREFGSVGDSLMAEFVSIKGALRSARKIQSEVEKRNYDGTDAERMRLRIGLDSGEVLTDAEGSIFGDTVNIAARLQGLAAPGGICLSGSIQEQLLGKGEFELKLLGKQQVKNIQRPITVYSLGKGNPPNGPRALRFLQEPFYRVAIALSMIVLVAWVTVTNLNSHADNSLAILPFKNVREVPSLLSFSAGLSDDVLQRVANLPDIAVVGRTSSFSKTIAALPDARAIGEQLDVNTILEGSVDLRGDTLRVTALLNDASSNRTIWSKTYDRKLADTAAIEINAFRVQDKVAQDIIQDLRVHFGLVAASSQAAITEITQPLRLTENRQAYELFRMARIEVNRFDFYAASMKLRQAIYLDDEFAEAYEMLAYSYWYLAGTADISANLQKLSYQAATRALELNDQLVFAQALQIAADQNNYSLLNEIDAFETALEAQPNNTWARGPLIFRLMEAGYLNKALQIAERYVELDPLSPVANNRLFEARYAVGQINAARQALNMVQELDPGSPGSPGSATWALAHFELAAGNDAEAIRHFEEHFRSINASNVDWVGELIRAARDPSMGQAYLDRRIPEVLENTIPPEYRFDAQTTLHTWYLFFDFLPREFELLAEVGLVDDAWTDADVPVWLGTMFRDTGFTADPAYLDLAEKLGFLDIWAARGAPDFCQRNGDEWTCS
ncbi:MAG: adenylate/guanylate cyclase domain-containing protein [Gammaproteobacteria bacterium]